MNDNGINAHTLKAWHCKSCHSWNAVTVKQVTMWKWQRRVAYLFFLNDFPIKCV